MDRKIEIENIVTTEAIVYLKRQEIVKMIKQRTNLNRKIRIEKYRHAEDKKR